MTVEMNIGDSKNGDDNDVVIVYNVSKRREIGFTYLMCIYLITPFSLSYMYIRLFFSYWT